MLKFRRSRDRLIFNTGIRRRRRSLYWDGAQDLTPYMVMADIDTIHDCV